MYHEFFQLSKPPFNNTPDPAFFYASPDHEEALATMHFGVQQRRGFVLVTGEVGSGKTLLVRMLMERLGASASVAVVDRPPVDEQELLTGVCNRLGVRARNNSSFNELIGQLERFLVARNASGRLCVVVIDEAQSLSMAALEQLRMLGNLETATEKLLQVILLGQPELQLTLGHSDLKQLRQRLYCSRNLTAFTPEQTAAYIQHRLRVAGAEDRTLFTPDAITALHPASEGLPRMINHICDNSLLMAFSESKPLVDGAIVSDVLDRMMNVQIQAPGGPTPMATAARSPAVVLNERRPIEADLGPSGQPSALTRELELLYQRAAAERAELTKLLRELSVSREDAAVERAQLGGAITRGKEMHDGLTTLLASCDREADKLFIVEDRATAKVDDLSRGIASAETLQKRLKSRVSRGLSLLRALGSTGESAGELRDELSRVCSTADAQAGELKVLSTSAGLRAEQLQAEGHHAAELEQRLGRRTSDAEALALRLEDNVDGRLADIDKFSALVEKACEHERALGELVPAANEIEARCAAGREQAVVLHADLMTVAEDAREQLQRLQRGLKETLRVRGQAGRAVRHLVGATRSIDRRLVAAEARKLALSAGTNDARTVELRLTDAASGGQQIAAKLESLSSGAGVHVAALEGATTQANRAEVSLVSETQSAVALEDRLQQVAGKAAMAAERALHAGEALDARTQTLEATRASIEEAAARTESAVASAEKANATLQESRRSLDDDAVRVESLVLRAETVAESLHNLDLVRKEVARATAEAAQSAAGLTESLQTLDQRMERVGSAIRSAEVTGERLDRAVERGAAVAERVTTSEQAISELTQRLERTSAEASREHHAARSTAERVEAAVRSVDDRIEVLQSLRGEIDDVHRVASDIAGEISSLAAKIDDARSAPDRMLSEAAAMTKQLNDAIQLAGQVVRGLSTSASRVRDQIRTLKEVRASSDRGVSRLLEQSRASADALRQWVTDAESARMRITTTTSEGDDREEVEVSDGNGSPDLLPALDALLARRP